MEDLSNVRFADTPLKRLPAWIGTNMTSYAGIRRTLGVSFLNFQHSQRYKFPGPVAPLFVICATMGAMLQHEFHEGTFALSSENRSVLGLASLSTTTMARDFGRSIHFVAYRPSTLAMESSREPQWAAPVSTCSCFLSGIHLLFSPILRPFPNPYLFLIVFSCRGSLAR